MRVFIAVPQYLPMSEETRDSIAKELGMDSYVPTGTMGHPKFEASIEGLKRLNIDYCIYTLRKDAILDRARALLLGVWYKLWQEGDKYDYFWMLDDDLEFSPSLLASLIFAGKPIVGSSYAHKADEDEPKHGMSVCRILPGEVPDEKGIVKIRWLNGGCILVRADVLLKMINHYPELRFDWNQAEEGNNIDIKESWNFWGSSIYESEGKRVFLSEDYSFCQRATEAGFDIWLDLKPKLIHWRGTKSYFVGGRLPKGKEISKMELQKEVEGNGCTNQNTVN